MMDYHSSNMVDYNNNNNNNLTSDLDDVMHAFNTTINAVVSARRETPEFPKYLQVSVTVLYICIFLLGIAGNCIVILVVVLNKNMRNSMNIFLINLCVADLLVLTLCMPTALVDAYARDAWYFGSAMCKIVPFLENLVTHSSVLTLIAISVERYRVVCRPLKGIRDNIAKSAKIVPVLWLISISCNLPYVYLAVYRDSSYPDGTPIKVCRMSIVHMWQKAYVITVFALHFVIPFIVLLILYIRICYILHFTQDDNDSLCSSHQPSTRRRLRLQVINIILSLILLFFLFHLPMRVISMWASFTPGYHKVGLETYLNIMYTGRIMFYLNHAINPIIYNFVSTKFRHALKSTITRRRYRGSVMSSNRRNTPLTRPKQSMILLVDQDYPNGQKNKNGDGSTSSSTTKRRKMNEFYPMYSHIIANHDSKPDDTQEVNAALVEKS